MIHGIHDALLVLGALTILSTLVFRELKSGDGDAVSRQNTRAAERALPASLTPEH
jgi:hypothetical protein